MILLTLGIIDYEQDFLPYENIYFSKITSSGVGVYFDQWVQNLSTNTKQVNSVFLTSFQERVALGQAQSIELCQQSKETFYFDINNQILYINTNNRNPRAYTVQYGESLGFSNGETVYFSGQEYAPFLLSSPTISKAVDPIKTSKMKFESQIVKLTNGEGEVDNFIYNPITGIKADIFYYYKNKQGEQISKPLYSGFGSKDSYSTKEAAITLKDQRQKDSRITYLKRSSNDKIIPALFGGYAKGFKGDRLDDNGVYQFFETLPDSTKITSFVKDENDNWYKIDTGSVDQSNGTITYPLSTIRPDGSKFLNVKIDINDDSSYKTAPEIIKEINEVYGGISFNEVFYDTVKYNEESELSTGNCNLIIDKEQELYKWIEKLQNSAIRQFKYDFDAIGRRYIKVYYEQRETRFKIDSWQTTVKIERDFNEYATTVKIPFASDLEGVQQFYTDDSFKDERIKTYGVEENYEIKEKSTMLNLQSDAQTKAYNLAKKYYPALNLSFSIDLDLIDYFDIELFDVLEVDTRSIKQVSIDPIDIFNVVSTPAKDVILLGDIYSDIYEVSDSEDNYIEQELVDVSARAFDNEERSANDEQLDYIEQSLTDEIQVGIPSKIVYKGKERQYTGIQKVIVDNIKINTKTLKISIKARGFNQEAKRL